MINDPVFWKVLWNNLWFALGTIPASVALAIVMALWVNDKLAGRSFVRMAYFTPTVLPLIAVANIWLFFYTPGFGLFDQITGFLFGWPASNYLGNPETALNAIIVVDRVEGSRVLHDLLPRRPAGNSRLAEGGGANRGGRALDDLLAHYLPAADADNAFCLRQCRDQFFPARGSHFHSEQTAVPDNASALLLVLHL